MLREGGKVNFIKNNGALAIIEKNSLKWLNYALTDGTQYEFAIKGKSELEVGGYCRPVYQYCRLPLTYGREYLIPLDPRQAAVDAISLYNSHNMKTRVAKALLTMGLKLGIAQPFMQKIVLLNQHNTSKVAPTREPLFEHLKKVLGHRDLRFAIYLGNPGPIWKPVIFIISSDGKALCYAKVGWNKLTRQLVENEKQTLECLNKRSFEFGRIPRIIYFSHWGDKRILITEALPINSCRSKPVLSDLHINFLLELSRIHLIKIPFIESNYFKRLSSRMHSIKEIVPSDHMIILQTAYELVINQLSYTTIPMVWRLGDFTPWNICIDINENKTLLIDLEYAESESIPGYDIFHFLSQTSKSSIDICDLCTGRDPMISHYFQKMNIDLSVVPFLYISYMLDLLTMWYQMWKPYQITDEAVKVFREKSNLVSELMEYLT